jgi:LCP family protein required for cell wall assembly
VTEDDRSNVPGPPDSSRLPSPEASPAPQTLGAAGTGEAQAARPRRVRRWWKLLAWGIPILVLVAGGLGLGLYLYTLGHVTVGTGEAGYRRQPPKAFGWPLRLNDRVNVLIIGIDVTLDEKRRVLNVSRSDSLILTSFDPERHRMYALSIPRDTRAEIPGHGTDKINAAYAYGGPRLTTRTVEKFLGVKVDFYVKLGPQSFTHLIDAVGGIDIDVEKDMKYTDTWGGFTIDLKKGFQHLNGQEATGYIRFRHDALGDIGRVERQRKVMQVLLRKMKQPSVVPAAPKLLEAFAKNTQTDLTSGELMTLGLFVLRSGSNSLQEYTLPGTFAPTYWEPDVPKIQTLVADLFYDVTGEELASTTIAVENGSGNVALGPHVVARIEALGFKSVRLRPGAPADVTTIVDRTGHPHVVRMLATTLGKAVIKRTPPSKTPSAKAQPPQAAITIVLAKDAAPKVSGTVIRRSGN